LAGQTGGEVDLVDGNAVRGGRVADISEGGLRVGDAVEKGGVGYGNGSSGKRRQALWVIDEKGQAATGEI
jgi:hypothetical protein